MIVPSFQSLSIPERCSPSPTGPAATSVAIDSGYTIFGGTTQNRDSAGTKGLAREDVDHRTALTPTTGTHDAGRLASLGSGGRHGAIEVSQRDSDRSCHPVRQSHASAKEKNDMKAQTISDRD